MRADEYETVKPTYLPGRCARGPLEYWRRSGARPLWSRLGERSRRRRGDGPLELEAAAIGADGLAGEAVVGRPGTLTGFGIGSPTCLAMTSSKVMVWAMVTAPWHASAKP